jgi:hypothetical protein
MRQPREIASGFPDNYLIPVDACIQTLGNSVAVPAILRQKKKYPNLPAQIMLKK